MALRRRSRLDPQLRCPQCPPDVTVTPGAVGADKDAFIRFPYPLYQDDPNWVPPLEMERKDFLDPKKNPWFEFGKVELFLARRGGQVVGRIAAVNDPHYNEFHGTNAGLLRHVRVHRRRRRGPRRCSTPRRAWLRAAGLHRDAGAGELLHQLRVLGLLVEGFDAPPAVMMAYNPPLLPRAVSRPAASPRPRTCGPASCPPRSRRRRRWRASRRRSASARASSCAR